MRRKPLKGGQIGERAYHSSALPLLTWVHIKRKYMSFLLRNTAVLKTRLSVLSGYPESGDPETGVPLQLKLTVADCKNRLEKTYLNENS